jgi:hypothetical protein
MKGLCFTSFFFISLLISFDYGYAKTALFAVCFAKVVAGALFQTWINWEKNLMLPIKKSQPKKKNPKEKILVLKKSLLFKEFNKKLMKLK